MSSGDAFKDFSEALRIERDQLTRFVDHSPQQAPAIEKAISILLNVLEKQGKIIVSGIGKSGKVAEKIAATLSSTGSLAVFLHPTEGMHGDLGIVAKDDAVVALSYSGNTEEWAKLLPSFTQRGTPVIAIVGNMRSQLAKAATIAIDASVSQEACPLSLAPTSSTTLALAIGDALAVALMKQRGFDEKQFARNHPAGGIGKRLTLTVADVMHQAAPVSPQAGTDEVLQRATETKLGGVLVTEGTKLVGLITDGDIRRALSHREKFFSMTAQDIMTARPITVTPDRLAFDALRLMEERPSQISVLPVVDEHGNGKGIVRLHDLVRIL